MSLKSEMIPPVPEETARIARTAFSQGNRYMMMRDVFGTLYQDEDFSSIFPTRGQPGLAPWRLALVTIMQFAEGLSDRQAAEAVQARIDWKYALSLELTDTGFDASVLSEFRSRLVEHEAGRVLLETLLETFRASGLLKATGSSVPTPPMCWRLYVRSIGWNASVKPSGLCSIRSAAAIPTGCRRSRLQRGTQAYGRSIYSFLRHNNCVLATV